MKGFTMKKFFQLTIAMLVLAGFTMNMVGCGGEKKADAPKAEEKKPTEEKK